MEALFILIPLSLGLVLIVGLILVWAAMSGQFESVEQEGARILDGDVRSVDETNQSAQSNP